MCAKHGIYAASHALRHADIQITSQHYLDRKRRATVGMGHLLASAENVIRIEATAVARGSALVQKARTKRVKHQ